MLGTIEGKRRKGWQSMRWLDGNTNSVGMNLSRIQEIVEDCGGWHTAVHMAARVRLDLATEEQQFIEHFLAASHFSKCWHAMVDKGYKDNIELTFCSTGK